MVVRIHNLGKWSRLDAAQAMVLELPHHDGRKVRLSVNCEHDAAFTVVEIDKEGSPATFLGHAKGLEDFEFYVKGTVQVVATSEGDVWYFTNDGADPGAVLNVEAVSFTKIANRRARNPELEAVMWKAEVNMNRRMARLEAEAMARIEGRLVNINRDTGEIEDGTQDGADDTAGTAGEEQAASGADEPSAAGQGGTAAKPAASGTGGTAKPAK